MTVSSRADLWKLLPFAGNAVELGVANGRFSEEMLGWELIKKVWMIDLWTTIPGQRGDASSPQEWHDENYKTVIERVARHPDELIIVRTDTAEAAFMFDDESFVLVFVDGNHSDEGADRDIRAWWSKLCHGGVMALDDFLNEAYGVREAAERFAGEFGVELSWVDVGEDSSIAWVIRP